MEVIGIRELRQYASRYLAQVEAGEELTITNRGRMVARLVPIPQQQRSREALIGAGVLAPARNSRGLSDITADRLPRRNLTGFLDEVRAKR